MGPDSALPARWHGELKDLFDAHLLVTCADLRTDELQKGLYAVGVEDKLDWFDLDYLFDAASAMSDSDFANWEEFRQQHEALIDCGPAEMMQTVAERLGSLLSEFREHVPFLRAINAAPEDEVGYGIYADWLESRGYPRGQLLRFYIRWAFRHEEPTLLARARRLATHGFGSEEDLSSTCQAMIAAMQNGPQ